MFAFCLSSSHLRFLRAFLKFFVAFLIPLDSSSAAFGSRLLILVILRLSCRRFFRTIAIFSFHQYAGFLLSRNCRLRSLEALQARRIRVIVTFATSSAEPVHSIATWLPWVIARSSASSFAAFHREFDGAQLKVKIIRNIKIDGDNAEVRRDILSLLMPSLTIRKIKCRLKSLNITTI